MNLIISPSNYFFNPHAVPFFISGILIIAQSAFVYLQNRRSILNMSFACIALSCGIWLTGVAIIYSSGNESTAYIWARYYDWIGIVFIGPAVFLFSTVLGRTPSKRMTLFAYFNFGIAVAVYVFCAVTGDFIVGVWSYSWGYFPRGDFLGEGIYVVWFYALMLLSFRNFIHDYKRESSLIKKKQIKIVIIAHVFGFLGSLDYIANFGISWYTSGSVFLLIYSSIFAYAIVNYKLMDIETVLHKTVLWILSFAIIAVPILWIYHWVFPYMKESSVLQIIFGALSFVMFAMYLRLVQPKIDHFFQRRKANLEEISSQFSEDLVSLKGIDNLVARIQKVVSQTVYPQWIDVFICNKKKTSYRLPIGV